MTHENRSLTDTLDLKDTKPINFTPNPSPSIPSNKFTLGIIACFGQAIVAMVLIQALIPARTIGESLSEAGVSEPGELMWLTAACIITASAFTLPAARITDYIGTRKAYIGSMMWLMIWTELAAFGGHVQRAGSSGLTFISVCRAMQGIGIAFLGPMCCDMLQQMYPSAFTSALIAISGVVGAVIGGIITCAFASGSNWKWSFVLLSVICIALAVLGLLVLPRMQRQSHDSRHGSLWTHLDALGMFSGGAGVVLFTIGLNLLSLVSPGKPYPYLMMVVGLILFAWFLFTERSALSPVLPFASITTRAYIVLACLAIYWGALTVWLWYLVQILEHIREWKPILISAGLIPMLIIGIGGAFGTRFAIRIASSEVVMFSTAGLSFIGYVVMATAENEIYWRSPFFSILLASPGTVMFTLSAMRLLSDNVAPRFPSSLTALAFAIVAFGMSVALGFAGTIERAINGGDEGQLTEYRGGQYVGLSLSALVLVLSLSLLISGHLRR
jgi:MFS family permease